MIKKISALIIFFAFTAAFVTHTQAAEKNSTTASPLTASLNKLQTELSSFFASPAGDIVSVHGDVVTLDKGSSSAIKVGMRITAFKEGASFTHPVTKEYLGKMEMPVGSIEITSVNNESSQGKVISGTESEFKGVRFKVPGKKVRLFFYQGNVDWNLGDTYFRSLQDSARFDMIDTGMHTATTAEILAEAKKKGAEIVAILSSEELKNTVELNQKLFWVGDGKQFSDAKISIALASIKQLKFTSGAFAWRQGEALLTYKLPISAKRMAVGDFRGNGQMDLVLATDRKIAVYKLDVDLKLLWEVNMPSGSGDILWIDTLDVNKDGRDEILVTTATGVKSSAMAYYPDENLKLTENTPPGNVRSFIFSLDGDKFKPLWRGENVFIRALEKSPVIQEFSSDAGFDGKIYSLDYNNNRFTKGQSISIPKGLNIFDFQFVYAPDGRRGLFAWDETGFINFFNDKGIRTWTSKEDFGGFSDSFKKESQNVLIDKGNWTLKDKFVSANSEVLAPKRKPMFGFVNIRSLGYSSSELRSFWWNGITVEERSYLEEVDGSILDYVVIGDRLMVLVKPYLLHMNSVKNIFNGDSPTAMMLYVFSAKGR